MLIDKDHDPRQKKPLRFVLFLKYHRAKIIIAVVIVLLFVVSEIIRPSGCIKWAWRHSACYTRELGVHWVEAPIHDIHRDCPLLSYEIDPDPGRICITTLNDQRRERYHDEKKEKQSSSLRWRCRSFDDVHTYENQASFADKHGYSIRDGSDVIDHSRPPAWSKIRAVLRWMDNASADGSMQDDPNQALEQQPCDWIFWMDADVVIMNSDVLIESFLPLNPDIFLLGVFDPKFTYNSGTWLIRNNDMARDFLQTWWNQSSLVIPRGASLSGDNRAFGQVLTDTSLPFHKHVARVPKCVFGSYAVFLSSYSWWRTDPQSALKDESQPTPDWYLSENFYHKGDFIAHAGGIDKKDEAVKLLLERAV